MTPRPRRWIRLAKCATAGALVALVVTAPAFARDGTPEQPANTDDPPLAAVRADEAKRLFSEAAVLYDAGQIPLACKKFETSERLHSGLGTKFRLADCWERIGRIASARAGFIEVANGAQRLGQPERERAARERAEQLTPRLSYLVVQSEPSEGLEVRREGTLVEDVDLGRALPVDPGSYEITLKRQGATIWSTTARVHEAERTVVIAPLPATTGAPVAASEPVAAVAPAERPRAQPAVEPTATESERPGPLRRGVTLALAGTGVGALLAGTALIAHSVSSTRDADAPCLSGPVCSPSEAAQRAELRDDAHRERLLGIVGVSVGAVAVLSATYLYATAPHGGDQEAAARGPAVDFTASVGPNRCVASVRGKF